MKKFRIKSKKIKNMIYYGVGPFIDGAIHHAGVMFPVYLITKPNKSLKGNIAFQVINAGLYLFEIWKLTEYSDCSCKLYDAARKQSDSDYKTLDDIKSWMQTLNEETEDMIKETEKTEEPTEEEKTE